MYKLDRRALQPRPTGANKLNPTYTQANPNKQTHPNAVTNGARGIPRRIHPTSSPDKVPRELHEQTHPHHQSAVNGVNVHKVPLNPRHFLPQPLRLVWVPRQSFGRDLTRETFARRTVTAPFLVPFLTLFLEPLLAPFLAPFPAPAFVRFFTPFLTPAPRRDVVRERGFHGHVRPELVLQLATQSSTKIRGNFKESSREILRRKSRKK